MRHDHYPLYRNLFFAGSLLALGLPLKADRIYIFPGSGYDQCDIPLSNAIAALGHTVVLASSTATTLPPGFTCTTVDPLNGYDWLCFFGDDHIALIPEIQAFIALGGKVYLQYEVSCCTISSNSAAVIASAVTGLTITTNPLDYLCHSGGANMPGWEAAPAQDCYYATGNAYKCMDGIPAANALNATADVGAGAPSYTNCENFGFRFRAFDLPGGTGGLIGIGDINLWYTSAGEPPNNGGTQPVDAALVSAVFPNTNSPCQLLPPGATDLVDRPAVEEPLVRDLFPNPASDQVTLDLGAVREVTVLNGLGQVVRHITPQGAGLLQINTSSFATGLYQIKVSNGQREEVIRFAVE